MTLDAPYPIKYALSQRTEDQQLLHRLACDPDVMIRLNVVVNQFASAELLSRILLTSADGPILVCGAQRTTSVQDLEYLAHRLCDLKWSALAAAILDNPHSSDAAKAIAVMVEPEG